MIQKHASLNSNVLPPSKNQKEVTELTFSEEQKASRGSDHRHRQVLRKRAMLPFFSFEIWAVSNHQGAPRVTAAQIKDMTGLRSSLFQEIGVLIKTPHGENLSKHDFMGIFISRSPSPDLI